MSPVAIWRRTTAGLVAVCATAVLLSGCVVSSTEPLFATSEALTDVLPASFEIVTYSENEGAYTVTKQDPQILTLQNGGWVSEDGKVKLYFIGMEDPDDYLMAAVAPDGTLYAATRIDTEGIMAIRMVLDADPATIDDLPSTVTVADGGIIIDTRADLEAVFRLISNGTLPASPLIAYVGGGTPPPRIVADGDWFRAE